jgi:hypothetical protein
MQTCAQMSGVQSAARLYAYRDLVVIVVIAILGSLVAPNVFRHVGTAKDATARAQIEWKLAWIEMRNSMRIKQIITIAVVVGVVFATPITYIAAKVNSQGEYDGPSGHLSALILARGVFAPCFLLTGGLVFLGGLGVRWLSRERE